jgi:stringent starvation protein B
MDTKASEKKERLLGTLESGMVMIHLDARRPGVLVPPHLREEFHLRLNLSYRFDPPDLSVSEWGVRSTLSFSGTRFTVAVPWSALFAITSYVTKEFWMYPDDMPPELLQQAALVAQTPTERASPPKPAKPGVVRAVITGEKDGEPPTDGGGGGDKPSPRGHLRLVK